MKLKTIAGYSCLMLFIVFSSGCMQERVRNVTVLASITSSVALSSVTAVPSLTSSPVNTATPTPTMTAIPTLPAEKARARLLDLLALNGGCRLPCLWGITPGKSSYQDVQVVLMALSSLSYSLHLNPSGSSDVTPRLAEGDLEIYNRVAFLSDPNETVYRVAYNVEAHKLLQEGGYLDIFDSEFFGERIGSYALPHILSEQGVPLSIMISTYGGPLSRGGTGGFDILLLYPDQGILVNYTTQMQLSGTNVRGCPSNAHVEMELYPPGNSESFYDLLNQTDWGAKFSAYQPLEQVTSMSSEEFYETFRQPTDNCVETSAKLWPTQEP